MYSHCSWPQGKWWRQPAHQPDSIFREAVGVVCVCVWWSTCWMWEVLGAPSTLFIKYPDWHCDVFVHTCVCLIRDLKKWRNSCIYVCINIHTNTHLHSKIPLHPLTSLLCQSESWAYWHLTQHVQKLCPDPIKIRVADSVYNPHSQTQKQTHSHTELSVCFYPQYIKVERRENTRSWPWRLGQNWVSGVFCHTDPLWMNFLKVSPNFIMCLSFLSFLDSFGCLRNAFSFNTELYKWSFYFSRITSW